MGSIEAIAVAWAPKASAWMGGQGGSGVFRSGSRAEAVGGRLAGIEDSDLALLLWQCGLDDRTTYARAWAALMVAGSHAAAAATWPKGRLAALVHLAMQELATPTDRWTDEARRSWVGLGIPQSSWAQTWKGRYQGLLTAAWNGAGRARWRIAMGRDEDGWD